LDGRCDGDDALVSGDPVADDGTLLVAVAGMDNGFDVGYTLFPRTLEVVSVVYIDW
jgi:hypothetical protein